MGDAQLSAETTISNFDMSAFYSKFLRDIRDSQEFLDSKGQLPDCVPFYGHGGLPADPAWSAAYPFITNWVSEYYADDRVVATHYDGVKAFMDSQTAQLDGQGVLSFARYGDWCSVADGASTGVSWNRADISHWHYSRGLDITADFARKLGNAGDQAKYEALAATARAKYLSVFYDAATHVFSDRKDDYPISQMLALDLYGLVPDADRDAVFADLVLLINNGTHSRWPPRPAAAAAAEKAAAPRTSAAAGNPELQRDHVALFRKRGRRARIGVVGRCRLLLLLLLLLASGAGDVIEEELVRGARARSSWRSFVKGAAARGGERIARRRRMGLLSLHALCLATSTLRAPRIILPPGHSRVSLA